MLFWLIVRRMVYKISFLDLFQGGGISYEVESSISNYARNGKLSNLRRYFKYFSFPLRIFLWRKEYQRIIGWQQFYALIFCFFCSIFHVKKQQEIIVALNFTYKEKKGFIGKVYKWFMKKAVCNDYLDFIHVPSEQYAKTFCKEFHISESKMIVCPFGVNDRYEEFKNEKLAENLHLPEHYALAIGRSNRDYSFLMSSWSDISIPLVIVCDQWEGDLTSVPSNVIWLNSIHGNQQYSIIINCDVLVLALKDGSIPSGDTVLLTAMSFGKRIIVSRPSAIADMYVLDNVNALTFEKTQRSLTDAIYKALNNDSFVYSARESYEKKYSQFAMGQRIGNYLIADDN